MAQKKYFMVLDTETANGLDDPLVYDIGFAIVDKKGQVYLEKSYVIYDTFVLMKDLMETGTACLPRTAARITKPSRPTPTVTTG